MKEPVAGPDAWEKGVGGEFWVSDASPRLRQELRFDGLPSGGSFRLAVDGALSTEIEWSSDPSILSRRVASALLELPGNFGSDLFQVTGTSIANGVALQIEYQGAVRNLAVADLSGLTGSLPEFSASMVKVGTRPLDSLLGAGLRLSILEGEGNGQFTATDANRAFVASYQSSQQLLATTGGVDIDVTAVVRDALAAGRTRLTFRLDLPDGLAEQVLLSITAPLVGDSELSPQERGQAFGESSLRIATRETGFTFDLMDARGNLIGQASSLADLRNADAGNYYVRVMQSGLNLSRAIEGIAQQGDQLVLASTHHGYRSGDEITIRKNTENGMVTLGQYRVEAADVDTLTIRRDSTLIVLSTADWSSLEMRLGYALEIQAPKSGQNRAFAGNFDRDFIIADSADTVNNNTPRAGTIGGSQVELDTVITSDLMPDNALRLAIARALGVQVRIVGGEVNFVREIRASDLARIEVIDLSSPGAAKFGDIELGPVTDLRGLEYAINLRSLNLANQTITDLSRLRPGIDPMRPRVGQLGAGALEVLVLDGVDALRSSDPLVRRQAIDVIASLSTLTHLSIDNHRLDSLYGENGTSVGDLFNLRFLSADSVAGEGLIHDLSPLAALKELRWLSLRNQQITDIRTLLGLTHLTQVDLSGNAIREIAPLAGEFLIDNTWIGSGGGFSTTGSWLRNLESSTGSVGGSGLFALPSGGIMDLAGEATAQWFFENLPAGQYEVLISYNTGENRSAAAPFTVEASGMATLQPVSVDQRVPASAGAGLGGVRWHSLGSYEVASGDSPVDLGSLKVILSNVGANGIISADAVRLVRVDVPAPEVIDLRNNPLSDISLDWYRELIASSISDDGLTSIQTPALRVTENLHGPSFGEGFAPLPLHFPGAAESRTVLLGSDFGLIGHVEVIPSHPELFTAGWNGSDGFTVTRVGTDTGSGFVLFRIWDGNPNQPGSNAGRSAEYLLPVHVGESAAYGSVFDDADASGTRTHGEAGVDGRFLYIDRNGNGTPDAGEWTATDAAGRFLFTGLEAGTRFDIREDLPGPGAWTVSPLFGRTLHNILGIESRIESVAVAENGDLLVSGIYSGPDVRLDQATLPATSLGSNRDIFIARLSPTGELDPANNVGWLRVIPGSSATLDNSRSVSFDADGNIFVTGRFAGNLNFGMDAFGNNIVLNSVNSNSDAYVAKFDPEGNLLWAKNYGGTGSEDGVRVLHSATGIHLVGTFTAAFTLPGGLAVNLPGGSSAAFVTALDPATGNALRVGVTTASSGSVSISDAVVNDAGRILLLGIHNGRVSMMEFNDDGVSLTTSTPVSLTSAGSTGATAGGIAIHSDGIFVSGRENLSGFVAKLPLSGGSVADWRVDFTSDQVPDSSALSLRLDSEGNPVVGGVFSGTLLASGAPDAPLLVSQGSNDLFVAKFLATDGSLMWAKSGGSAQSDTFSGLVLADDHPVLFGATSRVRNEVVSLGFNERGAALDLIFDSTGQPFNGGISGFFVKLDRNGSWLPTTQDPVLRDIELANLRRLDIGENRTVNEGSTENFQARLTDIQRLLIARNLLWG